MKGNFYILNKEIIHIVLMQSQNSNKLCYLSGPKSFRSINEQNIANIVKNVTLLSIAPPIYSKTFKGSKASFRYLYCPKVEKNHFSKSPRQNISKLGLNNAHMISL